MSSNFALTGHGGVVITLQKSQLILDEGSVIANNSASGYGAVVAGYSLHLEINNRSEIYGNSAINGYGGVMAVADCTFRHGAPFDYITCATPNARNLTNVVTIKVEGGSSIRDNSAGNSGGVLFTTTTSAITVRGGSVMSSNRAHSNGGVGTNNL